MFEGLSKKLGDVFDRLRGRGALSEADVDTALREVRVALLDADVALPVVRDFVDGVRAIPRRRQPKDGQAVEPQVAHILERGKLKLDPERHTCHWDNRPVTLTVTEFLILQALAHRPGVVKTRDALMDAAYDDQVYVDDRTIDSHIKRLRKKFKQVDDSFDVIETLYGVGYRFKEA